MQRQRRPWLSCVAAALAFAFALSACSAPSSDPNSSGETIEVQRGALRSMFGLLDPHTATNAQTVSLLRYVYEGLYETNVEDPTQIDAQLAVGEPEQVDATTYKVKIREGATFHDGSSLTAEDVVFSFNRVLDPELGSFFTKFLANINEVTASGDTEVTFTLAKPSTLFKERISLVRILSEEVITGPNSEEALSYEPIGSGPYSVVSADPEQGAVLERYEGYNGPSPGVSETIELEVIGDPSARISALLSGSVDAIDGVQLISAETLEETGDVEVAAVPGYTSHILLLNAAKAPFDDVRVRQALMYALDRDQIIESAYSGYATISDSLMPTQSSAHIEPETTYRYDPEHAKELLSEAGYTNDAGPSFELQVGTEADGLLAGAQLMQNDLQAAGFEVELRPGQIEPLYSRVTDGSYQAFYAPATPAAVGTADAEFAYRWLYYGAFPEQFVYWTEPEKAEVESLLDQASTAVDQEQYLDLMQQVVDITSESGPIIPIVHVDNVIAWDADTVAGISPSPLGGIYFAKEGSSEE